MADQRSDHGPLTISVALATFNGAPHLREQLASIARQTRLPTELVVMDDDSSDGTVAILEEFARDAPFTVRLARNAKTLGWRDNFFKAMQACRCDLVALCDQDDVWHDEKLARCAAWFEKRRDLALVVHSGRVVDKDLNKTHRRWPPIRRTRMLDPDDAPMWFEHHGMALVFPRWLLNAVHISRRPHSLVRHESVLMNHDSWVCFIAPAAGSVLLLAEELVLYRRHEKAVSTLDPPLGGAAGIRGLVDGTTKAAGYRALAGRCLEAATFLGGLREQRTVLGSGQNGFRVARRVELHRKAARVLEGRAEVIAPTASRRTRLVRLMRLALAGAYGRQTRSGLGPSRLVLDLALATVTRVVNPPASGGPDAPERAR